MALAAAIATPNGGLLMPEWAGKFTQPGRHKAMHGGRNGAKTTTAAILLTVAAYREPLNVACFRNFRSDLKHGSHRALERAISRLGLDDFFESQENMIKGKNGTEITFHGLERNKINIKGMENIGRIWIDEAHAMATEVADLLMPIARETGVESWYTWNPTSREDWVNKRFIENPEPGDIIQSCCWYDNPWHTPDCPSEELRQRDLRNNPKYEHIWEAAYDDDGGRLKKVLPYALGDLCAQAFKQYRDYLYHLGLPTLGLDLADTGNAYNSLVTKVGPVLLDAQQWQAQDLGETARKANTIALETGANRLYYDAGGLGAGVRPYFRDMPNRDYQYIGELFGGKVSAPDKLYSHKRLNGDVFARKNSQLGWAVKLRAETTKRLMNGENVRADQCLFINHEIPRLRRLLAELAQPRWEESAANGKIEIKKAQPAEDSPDLYDATVLAFAQDSHRGLLAR